MKKKSDLKISDVAKIAGVSPATVSKVLNNKPGISLRLKTKVLKVINDSNYQPSRLARGLASGTTRTMALVIKRNHPRMMNDPFYEEVLHGVENEVSSAGYNLIYKSCEPDENNDSEFDWKNDFNNLYSYIDGIFLVGNDIPVDLLEEVQRRKIPAVLVDNSVPGFNCIMIDNITGSKLLTQRLIVHGKKRIGFIGGDPDSISFLERYDGFKLGHIESSANFSSELVIFNKGASVDSGYQGAKELIKKDPTIDAIICANDKMAVGAIKALGELGKRIPEDIAVTGFDNIEWSEHTNPPITTVDVPRYLIGQLAGKRLLEVVANPNIPCYRIIVPVSLVIRQSCGTNWPQAAK